jgi:hypothetical protein
MHAHPVAAVRRDDQVEVAVVIDVDRCDARGTGGGRNRRRALERTVAAAEQHAHGVSALIRRHDVEVAIVVEVTDGDTERQCFDRVVDWIVERDRRADTGVEHRHRVAAGVGALVDMNQPEDAVASGEQE